MCLKMFLILVILKTTIAYHPVILKKDKTVITFEPIKISLPKNIKNISPTKYPYYEVVTNPPIIRPTKASPISFDNENEKLPVDLIETASTKLGITNLEQIPSLSELSNLLGTTSREETIETIRELTETESGIDLIKAFIESLDYTDSTADKKDNIQIQSDTYELPVPTSETTQKDLNINKQYLGTPPKELGFFQRVCSYLNFFYLFPTSKEVPVSRSENELDHIKDSSKHNESHNQRQSKLQPISVANRFPNSFPVPYRSDASIGTFSLSTNRAMKEGRHLPEDKSFNLSLRERFLH
ncbi:uncharacterized protein LOC129952872 [Eupeodes corollae]|uniref:uncharacterized protein LOC129952872 n=1 Tax=Eupeodes corollae TaxID=290404 RepID=UPI00249381DB|nr:uncharacterized protein LOC129952872 [Eupeodes corollae]